MIRNGLYHISIEMLDGIKGGNQGVMVVRDGLLRGGDSFFYAFGTYTAADGKWKGEVTNQEHRDVRRAAGLGTQGGNHRLYRDLYRQDGRKRQHCARRQAEHSVQIEVTAAGAGLNLIMPPSIVGKRAARWKDLNPAIDRKQRASDGAGGIAGKKQDNVRQFFRRHPFCEIGFRHASAVGRRIDG
jgi:hypothetical protein